MNIFNKLFGRSREPLYSSASSSKPAGSTFWKLFGYSVKVDQKSPVAKSIRVQDAKRNDRWLWCSWFASSSEKKAPNRSVSTTSSAQDIQKVKLVGGGDPFNEEVKRVQGKLGDLNVALKALEDTESQGQEAFPSTEVKEFRFQTESLKKEFREVKERSNFTDYAGSKEKLEEIFNQAEILFGKVKKTSDVVNKQEPGEKLLTSIRRSLEIPESLQNKSGERVQERLEKILKRIPPVIAEKIKNEKAPSLSKEQKQRWEEELLKCPGEFQKLLKEGELLVSSLRSQAVQVTESSQKELLSEHADSLKEQLDKQKEKYLKQQLQDIQAVYQTNYSLNHKPNQQIENILILKPVEEWITGFKEEERLLILDRIKKLTPHSSLAEKLTGGKDVDKISLEYEVLRSLIEETAQKESLSQENVKQLEKEIFRFFCADLALKFKRVFINEIFHEDKIDQLKSNESLALSTRLQCATLLLDIIASEDFLAALDKKSRDEYTVGENKSILVKKSLYQFLKNAEEFADVANSSRDKKTALIKATELFSMMTNTWDALRELSFKGIGRVKSSIMELSRAERDGAQEPVATSYHLESARLLMESAHEAISQGDNTPSSLRKREAGELYAMAAYRARGDKFTKITNSYSQEKLQQAISVDENRAVDYVAKAKRALEGQKMGNYQSSTASVSLRSSEYNFYLQKVRDNLQEEYARAYKEAKRIGRYQRSNILQKKLEDYPPIHVLTDNSEDERCFYN